MEFAGAPYHATQEQAFRYEVPSTESVMEAIERIEPFLKGQGYLPMNGHLRVLHASAAEASQTLDLIFRLASQHQVDDRVREQLRDQADKDRVALSLAQKRNEGLEESNRRLTAMVKDLESKLLTVKHKAEEQERDLKQKLQSTTVRLNGYLQGGRDAGKRNAAVSSSASAAGAGPGGARRSAPAYDRFRDDPAEAAAATQKLEAELAQLRQQNLRLKKQLAAAPKPQTGGGSNAGLNLRGGSPVRDGKRGDQLAAASEGSPGEGAGKQRHEAGDAVAPESQDPSESSTEVAHLRRVLRDLQQTVEHLQRNKLELQRQLEKSSGDRAELHKTLQSLRTKCASLEVERKNTEDRFQRAQRANAALLDSAAAEAQLADLRAKLGAAQKETHEATATASALQLRLVAAEEDVEASKRHVEMLKRAIRALPQGPQALTQLEQLVETELQPLREKLQKAMQELAQRPQRPAGELTSMNTAAAPAPPPANECVQQLTSPIAGVAAASSPAPLPASPIARFDGFSPRLLPMADSPPMLHPPPVHAFYNRAFSATMPTLHSEHPFGAPIARTEDGSMLQQHHSQPDSFAVSPVKAAGGTPGSCGSVLPAGAGSPYMRRSVSAGVTHRMSAQYTSAERQRARWQFENNQAGHRFPSPIDILMEQARSVDGSISIRNPISEGSPAKS